jgi:ABC-2 type transport system ATP-binding protein
LGNTVLKIDKLSKSYKTIKAVNDLSLDIKEQMVFGILGPNGSGKTTTLGMLLGVINPQSGTYSWFDNGTKDANRKRIGSLLETPNFYPYLTAVQNLEISAKIKGVPNPSEDISEVLKTVDLFKRKDSKFSTFSLGMKQRLAIASTLLGDPEVLVFDEPTNGLDPQGIAEIRELIIDIGKKGKTILIASHILDEIEKVCTHCAILKEGNLVRTGTISEIIGNQESTLIKLSTVNLEDIKKCIDSDSGITMYKDLGNKIVISVSKERNTSELNQYFFDKGIVLSELSVYNETLENQFLEIIKKS